MTVTRLDLAFAAVALRPATRAAAAAGLASLGLAEPAAPAMVRAGGRAAFAAGADRWIVIASGEGGWPLERAVAAAVGDAALVTDQSDARTVFAIEGRDARRLLGRGASIDLHPRAFPPDTAAVTEIAGIGAWIWCETADAFRVAVPTSYAESFAEWVAGALGGLGSTN